MVATVRMGHMFLHTGMTSGATNVAQWNTTEDADTVGGAFPKAFHSPRLAKLGRNRT